MSIERVPADLAELSEAFAPCTDSGLVDEWWRLNILIAETKESRDNIEAILLRKSMVEAVLSTSVEADDWDGAIIAGKTCKVQAHRTLIEGGEHPRFDWKLKKVRDE